MATLILLTYNYNKVSVRNNMVILQAHNKQNAYNYTIYVCIRHPRVISLHYKRLAPTTSINPELLPFYLQYQETQYVINILSK